MDRGVEWLAFDWVRAERNEPAAAFLFSLSGACVLPGTPRPLILGRGAPPPSSAATAGGGAAAHAGAAESHPGPPRAGAEVEALCDGIMRFRQVALLMDSVDPFRRGDPIGCCDDSGCGKPIS